MVMRWEGRVKSLPTAGEHEFRLDGSWYLWLRIELLNEDGQTRVVQDAGTLRLPNNSEKLPAPTKPS